MASADYNDQVKLLRAALALSPYSIGVSAFVCYFPNFAPKHLMTYQTLSNFVQATRT